MDRRKFLAAVGPGGAALLGVAQATGRVPEELVESVEHILLQEMPERPKPLSLTDEELMRPLPEKPTLADVIRLQLTSRVQQHLLQSGMNALRRGLPEEIVVACLLHDLGIAIHRPDHGYWGAQMVKPYVSDKVNWAIQYHQALRFYPDPAVGYEYPELYISLFGEDYKPEAYLEADYRYARNHKWYMNSRLVTMMDEYSFDPGVEVPVEPFLDIIGRHFKQPEEGLGADGSPVAHMWRTLLFPARPL